MRSLPNLLSASVLAASLMACELDVPDLNNPGLADLEENPTAAGVSSACTGLIIGNRRNTAQANGYVAQMGILGREAYNFDQADPRFILELLESQLNPGSPFGGNFWPLPYANIRLANLVQRAVVKVADFSASQQRAVLGFSKTIEALDLLEIINARDTNGAVIDTDKDIHTLGAIVEKPMVQAEIARLLDEAAADLAMGGMAFPFSLSDGYAGFTKPADFLKFNRAIRARVAAYMKDYATLKTALDASFINLPADLTMLTLDALNVGVYHSYSTGAGDAVNNLINPNIYAHKSVKTDAKMQVAPNAGKLDARYLRKIDEVGMDDAGSAQGLNSNLVFTIYDAPSSPVAIIRNEELILLRAEQLFFGTPADVAGAVAALNAVREKSGGLTPVVGTPTAAVFTDELLYDRKYSLLFEGGHRLIDVRRFDRVTAKCPAAVATADCLPLDKPDTSKRNIRYPIPLAECNARPGEARCALSSQ